MSQTITRELLKKRAEHNDGELFSLEEVALHQQSIGKIENIDVLCPNLKIIYLQANEISKLENLRRLKALQYLNVALNKIEVVENLEGCESLEKLDLTLNCISQLSSLASLVSNYALREIYLTGNPCTKFTHYRMYVIGILPQLESLDGEPVLHTERVAAKSDFNYYEAQIKAQESSYEKGDPVERASEIRRQLRLDELGSDLSNTAPASEIIIKSTKEERILNTNKAGAQFTLQEEEDAVVLKVKIPKWMDTSLLDVDVQPTFVRVTIKGQLLQLTLPTEVSTDRAVAQRSLASGDLVITMPTVSSIIEPSMQMSAGNRKGKAKLKNKDNDMPSLEPIT